MSNACSISKRKLLAIVAAIIVALAACVYTSMTMKTDIASASEIAIGETTFATNVLEYDGTEKAAISKTGDADAQYRLDYENDAEGKAVWKTEIPTVKSIGVHTVQIKVDDQIEELKVEVVDASPAADANGILPISSEVGAPYIVPTYAEYTGTDIKLISSVGEVNGTEGFTAINYSLNGQDWSAEIPTGIEPGSHTVYIRVLKDSNNFYGFEVRACITKKAAGFAFNNYTDGEKTSMDYVEGPTYDFSANNADATYSVSDGNIAAIDGTGTVTLKDSANQKFGPVTITAMLAETEFNKAAKVGHTLVVKAPTPTLKMDTTDVEYVFGENGGVITDRIAETVYGDDTGEISYSYVIDGNSDLAAYGITASNNKLTIDDYDTLSQKLLNGDIVVTVKASKAEVKVSDDVIFPYGEASYKITITLADISSDAYSLSNPVSENGGKKYYGTDGVIVTATESYNVATSCGGTFDEKVTITEETSDIIEFYVKKNNGGIGYVTVNNIVIDTQKPVISDVTYNENGDESDKGTTVGSKTYFQAPQIKFTVTEANFDPNKVTVKLTNGSTETVIDPADITWEEGAGVYKAAVIPNLANKDGDYSVTIDCVDRSGNQAEQYSTGNDLIVVDTTAAEISVDYDSPKRSEGDVAYYNGSFTGTITVKEANFYPEDLTFDVEGSEEDVVLSGWNSNGDNHTATFELTADGDYVITASHTDKSQNKSSDYESKQKTIDATKPAISGVKYFENGKTDDEGTTVDNKIYFHTPQIKFEIKEVNFDADKVDLKVVNKDTNEVLNVDPEDITWENDGNVHTATYTPELEDGNYGITIDCIDKSDNAADKYSEENIIVVDKTKAKVSVSYTSPQRNKNGISYYGKGFTGTIKVEETNFYAEDFVLNVNGSKKELSGWKSEGDVHTVTFNLSADGDYVITALHTDKSQNKSDEYKSNQKTIDTKITEPTIRINGADGDGRAYKNQVVPSISFEDPNYESYKITLLRTRYDVREANVTSSFMRGVAVTSTGGSGSFDTFDRIRENDGIYKLTVEFSDILGHTSKKEITFTVNRFGSVYEFGEYLTEIIQNGGEYIKACEENLTITEYNPDRIVDGSLNIEITRDGKPLEDAEFRTTSTSSGAAGVGWYQYEYVIDKSNFKQDGLYKIDISSADATGNTPENNNFEDKKISFKVDATAPEITSIKGLEEPRIKANKQDVDFDVYDTIGLKSVEVYVDGKPEGKTITDFSADLNNYSGSFTLNESNKSQEVRIKVTDLAGNVTDTADNDFTSAYAFEDKVTVSTNIIALWFANKPLFFGTIAGVLIIAAAIWYALNGRRRREEEEEF